MYIKEEILEEAAVKDIGIFERFMEVAAISDGEIINYENIASDCGVAANTVEAYFQILYDTLIGYENPGLPESDQKKVDASPEVLLFRCRNSQLSDGKE